MRRQAANLHAAHHPDAPPPGCRHTGAVQRLLFDFREAAAVQRWSALDDRVMGGASRSRLRHDPAGFAVFEGVVSLEHGGGFASVRSLPGPLGLAGAQACVVELRGAPAPFKLSLLMDDGRDSVAWQAALQPDGTGWQLLRLPLAGFVARWRGRELPQAPPLEPARIRQLGLLTAGRRAGPFALDLRWIALE